MTITLEPPVTVYNCLTAPMPCRSFGRSGRQTSLLTLGGVKWDTLCTDSEAVDLIHRAIELGVNTFDTAFIYGNGESERKLGLALEGIRDSVWLNTKVIDRTYDGAKRQIETSLERLRTNRIDVLYVHSLDDEEQRAQIMSPNSVLKAIEEFRAAGHVSYVGISGHWVRGVMSRILRDFQFDAALFPTGLFNIAYDYSFIETVLPMARELGMAVSGMKILGAGRVKRAASIEPYLRYSMNLPIDSMVIGCDSVAQLEQTVRIIMSDSPQLTNSELEHLLPEALNITQEWDEGEFPWVNGYKKV